MSDKTPLQILKDGLAYLRENGWRRGDTGYHFPGDKVRVCAAGALYAGAEHTAFTEWSAPLHIAFNLLSDEVPGGRAVTSYNDRIAKRRRDVERLFERAIKKAEARA
ncbi:hypothetical protein NJBCHELONAE_48900 [Mycobacteroides chelonae]|uniref:DUF6197 family protein n=1 Tax=Mycobacteroides chelonae TaxID=1774 RepID=UPI0021DB9C08|nr:hypothetical protein [Mycobacteroides chelonae]GLE59577.1 hypothetical protein NJBCHELONAE_48900 [Mycobacteroides chelonae]